MNFSSVDIVFFCILWWLVFFTVLPFGNTFSEKKVQKGNVQSAPEKPRLWRKALYTTIATAVLLVILRLLIDVNPFGIDLGIYK